MDKLFKLKEHGTDVRTEVLAGLTTFFAMSYILFVNPQMLSQTGMPVQGVFLATIIGSVVGTLMMAFYANLPYAQAPGMGLNAFFTFTVVFGMGYTWKEALGMVFICGIISLIITLTNVRKMIIESIPTTLRSAISAGIGVFLAYVGIKNAGLLKFSIDPGTYTVAGEGADKAQAALTANSAAVPGLVDFNTPAVLVALAGLAITIFFVVKGIKGGIILSILTTTVLAIAVGVVKLSGIDFASNNLSSAVNDLGTLFGAALGSEGLGSLISNTSRLPETLMAILAFSLTDIFDTIGTLIGTGEKVGIATAPILIIVGIMMLSNLKNIPWDDMAEAVPAFFTSIFMGFSYSITQGIAVGFLTYTLTKVVKGQAKDVHVMIWILDALFILNYISMAL